MILRTLICDICKEEIKSPDQPWLEIGITLNGHAFGGMALFPNKMQVHYNCWIEKMGELK